METKMKKKSNLVTKKIDNAEREIQIAQKLSKHRQKNTEKGKLPLYKYDPEQRKLEPALSEPEGISESQASLAHHLELCKVLNAERFVGAGELLGTIAAGCKENDGIASELNGALALIEQIAPRDPLETMLVIQMISAHQTAMDLNGRMRVGSSLASRDNFGRHAERLMRIYNQHLVTLTKYRTGGKQTVEVKHVNVESGGQAIIGDVHAKS